MENSTRLTNAVAINVKFNDKYKLQFLEPLAYNRICEIISLMRKNKEFTQEEHYSVSSMCKHLYLNFYKIKNLNDKEPRYIAQKFISKKNIRRFIFRRDNYKCLKCGNAEKLQIDHIIPITKRGENKISNLQTLCSTCNSTKRDNYKDYRNGAR